MSQPSPMSKRETAELEKLELENKLLDVEVRQKEEDLRRSNSPIKKPWSDGLEKVLGTFDIILRIAAAGVTAYIGWVGFNFNQGIESGKLKDSFINQLVAVDPKAATRRDLAVIGLNSVLNVDDSKNKTFLYSISKRLYIEEVNSFLVKARKLARENICQDFEVYKSKAAELQGVELQVDDLVDIMKATNLQEAQKVYDTQVELIKASISDDQNIKFFLYDIDKKTRCDNK
jgi:hypothetical protein